MELSKVVSRVGSRNARLTTASPLRSAQLAGQADDTGLCCAATCVRGASPKARHRFRSQSGQMTVELVVAFPVMIVVALIVVNAMTFFSECAVFDRVANESVRAVAASPAYRQTVSQSCGLVEEEIRKTLDAPNLEVSVSCSPTGFDCEGFTATLAFSPTLFGMGLRSEVLGVALPKLTHSTTYVVDVYKPGVVV